MQARGAFAFSVAVHGSPLQTVQDCSRVRGGKALVVCHPMNLVPLHRFSRLFLFLQLPVC